MRTLNNQPCGKIHHEKLHVEIDGVSIHNINAGSMRKNALIMIGDATSGNKKLAVVWDPGANISLVTHRAARRLGLRGKETTLSLIKVGETKRDHQQ